jgi:hypothetical protein
MRSTRSWCRFVGLADFLGRLLGARVAVRAELADQSLHVLGRVAGDRQAIDVVIPDAELRGGVFVRLGDRLLSGGGEFGDGLPADSSEGGLP